MVKVTHYVCTCCGQTSNRPHPMRRPDPGKCPKRDGQPHKWVISHITE